MKTFKVKITGLTPYMQHRMDTTKLEEWEKKRGLIMERPDVSQEDAVRAEFHCYRDAQGKCYVPASQLKGSFINAGSYVKSKVGGRSKSMKQIVAAMFVVTPDEVPIIAYNSIDKRSAVNKNVKARIITIRPKWTDWSLEFILEVGENSITIESITSIIEYAGNYVGIGSFRPTNNGMFGRFKLESIEQLQ